MPGRKNCSCKDVLREEKVKLFFLFVEEKKFEKAKKSIVYVLFRNLGLEKGVRRVSSLC